MVLNEGLWMRWRWDARGVFEWRQTMLKRILEFSSVSMDKRPFDPLDPTNKLPTSTIKAFRKVSFNISSGSWLLLAYLAQPSLPNLMPCLELRITNEHIKDLTRFSPKKIDIVLEYALIFLLDGANVKPFLVFVWHSRHTSLIHYTPPRPI